MTRGMHKGGFGMLVLSIMMCSAEVNAQVSDESAVRTPQEMSASISEPTQIGKNANTGSGIIGQRQTREQVAPYTQPLSRIDSRIANRVQNRLNLRIDENFAPQSDTSEAFRSAETETRSSRVR